MLRLKTRIQTLLSATMLALAVTGCASTQSYDKAETPGMSDPFENVNRKVFIMNKNFDHYILHPTLDLYRDITPAPARTALNNFINHIQSPISLTNHLLQGNLEGAGDTLFAAIVNTFAGFGGLMDVASYEGYDYEQEDFGQTLAVWGVNDGPYVVMPLLGPSSMRDGFGRGIDSLSHPINFYSMNIDEPAINLANFGASYLNARNNLKDGLEELEKSSIDYYAAVRSSYYQARKKQINSHNDAEIAAEFDSFDFPDYDED